MSSSWWPGPRVFDPCQAGLKNLRLDEISWSSAIHEERHARDMLKTRHAGRRQHTAEAATRLSVSLGDICWPKGDDYFSRCVHEINDGFRPLENLLERVRGGGSISLHRCSHRKGVINIALYRIRRRYSPFFHVARRGRNNGPGGLNGVTLT